MGLSKPAPRTEPAPAKLAERRAELETQHDDGWHDSKRDPRCPACQKEARRR